ncbi:hypothetical protein DFH09DRAFT_1307835 [Mycena vulgaris]|nr:hypothetical protein DFH09DRAFT_1307835 [Mycena vulgaris]
MAFFRGDTKVILALLLRVTSSPTCSATPRRRFRPSSLGEQARHRLVQHEAGTGMSLPAAVMRFGGGKYHPKAKFAGCYNGPVAAKGWQRRQVAKSNGKGKGKKRVSDKFALVSRR